MTFPAAVRAPRTVAGRLTAEIDRVVTTLRDDRAFALGTFATWRDKTPLLDAVRTTWPDETAAALLELTPRELLAAEAFFRELERFALWLRTTEAMPATLEARYDAALDLLDPLAEVAVTALGGPPREPPPSVPPAWASLRR